jgi:hypothetical protein
MSALGKALIPRVVPNDEAFQVIGQRTWLLGAESGRVGGAESHLFEGDRLLAFAVAWLESRFRLRR